jgi:hypothetical protein
VTSELSAERWEVTLLSFEVSAEGSEVTLLTFEVSAERWEVNKVTSTLGNLTIGCSAQ